MSLDIIQQPFAFQGDRDTPDQTSATGFVNFQDGYTKDYEISLAAGNPQAKAVERMVQNYMFNQATEHAMAWQRQAMPPWFAGMSDPLIGGYKKDAFVIRQQVDLSWKPYRSLVANNVSDPLTTPSQWEYVRNGSESLALIPMPAGAGNALAELIVIGVDFNTLTSSGTYEVRDETIFAACSNTPVLDGSSVVGMLEVKSWSDSTPKTRVIQIFTSSAGRKFVRYSFDGVWIAWSGYTTTTETRNDKYRWCAASTSDNLTYNLTATPAMTERVEGVRLRFKAPSTSTGTVLINDGIGAKPLYGRGMLALGAGSITNGNIFMAEWNSTAIAGGCWVLVSVVAAPDQLPTSSVVAASPPQFDVTTKVATMEALQRALGNYQDAVQLGIGATTNLTAAGTGKYLQAQGGTINLPLASAVKAGSAFIITASGSTVVSRTGSDLLYNGGVSSSTITMNDGDFLVAIALAEGAWEIFGTLGSTAAQFDNSRRYASTGFVQRALGSLSGFVGLSSSRSLLASDIGKAIFVGAASLTLTLPTPASLGATNGSAFTLFTTASSISIVPGSGAAINHVSTASVPSVTVQVGQSITFVAVSGTTWQTVSSTCGLDQNFDLFSIITSANNWRRLPGGQLVQCGQGGTDANGRLSITFPTAFLSATVAYQLVAIHAGTGPAIVIELFTARSLTGTILQVFNHDGTAVGAGLEIHWIAIGK